MMIFSFMMKSLIKSYLLLVRHILAVDLDKINLYNDNNFDEDDPDTIIHARFLAWCSKFKKLKAFKEKISEESMAAASHPKRWWNSCMSEDEKKEIEPIFTE